MPFEESKCSKKRTLLLAECIGLFFLLPTSLYFWRERLAFRIVPLVFALALLVYLLLRRDGTFNQRTLWYTPKPFTHLKHILRTFLPAALGITVMVHQFLPDLSLSFPRSRPGAWLLVMVSYPLLAAYPQEIIFRGFFFHRYGRLFPGRKSAIFFNALSFSLAHSVYFNWIAFSLTFLGGALFAFRYLKTGSLIPAAFEHGLWGDFLFTIGIGWYLYSGSIR